MKTLNVLALLVFSLLFIGCDNDNEEAAATIKLSSNSVALSETKTYETINIIRAEGICSAESSNNNVATVQLEDKKLIVVGVKTGEAMITVYDSEAKKAEVKVTVVDLDRQEAKTELIYVKKGTARLISFPYPASSGYTLLPDKYKEIIKLSTNLSDQTLYVEGKELGYTVFSVQKDYWTYCNYHIEVVDVYPLEIPISKYSTYPKAVKFGGGITIGNGDYKIVSSDPSIAVARIIPYYKEWTKTNANFNEAAFEIETTGKPGTTILTVTDAAGLSKKVEVEVRENN